MSNDVIVITYVVLVVIVAIMAAIAAIRDFEKRIIKRFLALCGCLLAWMIIATSHFIVNDPVICRALFDLYLPFIALSVVQVYLLSLEFYGHNKKKSIWIRLAIYVIPFITFLLAITSSNHSLLRSKVEYIQMEPIRILINIRGPWFWVHSLHSYSMLVAALFTILRGHKKVPRIYRAASGLFVVGIIASMMFNVLVLSGVLSYELDFTLVGMSVALIFVYVAIVSGENLGFLVVAQREIYSRLNDCVFILNNSLQVVDMNTSAKNLVDAFYFDIESGTFEKMLSVIAPNSQVSVLDMLQDEIGVDIAVLDNLSEDMRVYNMRIQSIEDKDRTILGYFASLSDVDRYRRLIDQFENYANLDALTGIGNRRSLESELTQIDMPENYPISIVMGDLNKLKEVNDIYGHKAGDSYIRLASSVLSELCPPDGKVFRIGGDEFLIVLPLTSEEKAQEFAHSVCMTFQQIKRYPYTPSISLGHATKISDANNISEVIESADSIMYENKRKLRHTQTS